MRRPLLAAIRTLSLLSALAAVPAAAGRTAWVSSNHVQVVDLDAGRVVGRLAGRSFVHAMAFTKDGRNALVATSDGLRVADAERLEWGQTLLQGTTVAVEVSADGSTIVAVTAPPADEHRAARKAGAIAPWTVWWLDGRTFSPLGSFTVESKALDIAIAPDGSVAYVLLPHLGRVDLYSRDGQVEGQHDLTAHLPKDRSGAPAAFLSRIELSPDGDRLAVPVTAEGFSAILDVDLRGKRPPSDRVRQDELGHARRIHGLAWDEDGGIVLSAVGSRLKFGGHGLPVAWKSYPYTFVDLAPLPGDEEAVVMPTFSEARGSGAVALLDARGELLRTIELSDMSPFRVVLRPE